MSSREKFQPPDSDSESDELTRQFKLSVDPRDLPAEGHTISSTAAQYAKPLVEKYSN